MNAGRIRDRWIELPAGISPGQVSSLRGRFSEMDGVEDCRFEGGRLEIHYHFPQVSLGMILRLIQEHTGSAAHGPGVSLAGWLEDNERDHLLHRDGWEKYLQDIYVDHYRRHRPQRDGQKRKEWQQYRRHVDPVKSANE